jgi:cell division septum initiation protein DivIVA
MSQDETSQLFPILQAADRSFEVSMRGYDRNQVEDYVARTDAEIQALAAERDAALARSADLAAQLANAHAQIEASRRQLAEATTAITPETVHARLRPLVENAHAEARQIRQSADADAMRVRALGDADAQETRRQANEDAQRMRGQAQEELQRATQAAAKREREADETLAAAQAAAAEIVNKARADAAKLLADTHAEINGLDTESTTTRQRLDAQAAAARVTANEDFEIALRVRRTEEMRVDEERRAAAQAEAERLVRDATQRAEEIVTEAHQELASLRDVRSRTHLDLHELHGRLGEVLAALPESYLEADAHLTAEDQ